MTQRVQTTVLPLSGWHIQWRPVDQHWRALSAEDFNDAHPDSLVHTEQSWHPYTNGHDDGAIASAFPMEAYEHESSWWMIFAELPPEDSPITVSLTDGTTPAVVTVGRVWACEWLSAPQQAEAHYPDGLRSVPFDRPGVMVAGPRYKSPPTPGGGWVRYITST